MVIGGGVVIVTRINRQVSIDESPIAQVQMTRFTPYLGESRRGSAQLVGDRYWSKRGRRRRVIRCSCAQK